MQTQGDTHCHWLFSIRGKGVHVPLSGGDSSSYFSGDYFGATVLSGAAGAYDWAANGLSKLLPLASVFPSAIWERSSYSAVVEIAAREHT